MPLVVVMLYLHFFTKLLSTSIPESQCRVLSVQLLMVVLAIKHYKEIRATHGQRANIKEKGIRVQKRVKPSCGCQAR